MYSISRCKKPTAAKLTRDVSEFLVFWPFFQRNFKFRPLHDLTPFLDPLLDAIGLDAEITCLGSMSYGAEVPAMSAGEG